MFENLTAESRQAILDIQLVQGDSKDFVFSFNDDAGNPLLLTGYTIKMSVKCEPRLSAPSVADKSIGSGLAIEGNNLTVTFGAETKSFVLDTYFYDILFVKGGKSHRLVKGKLLVSKSYTE